MTARPTRVKVGPFTWRIDQTAPEAEDTCAETALRELTIRVDGALPDDVWRETLLHELMHACHVVAGIDADDPTTGEAIVTAVSPLLFDALRSNARVRAHLLG